MLCFRRLLQQWSLALFLLCSPVPHYGRPIDALSGRMKRSVTHAQLMHDKGRTLQDFKRRMWLQELLDEVHTAVRELPERSSSVGGGVSAGVPVGTAGGGATGGGGGVSSGGSTLYPKPAGSTKNYPPGFRVEEEGTNLPQETHKSLTYKDQPLKAVTKKKKKGRSGKRRENDKKRRRTRSLAGGAWEPGSGGLRPEWWPYLEALH
ncbi:parathyroid hormone-related protein-like [Conger conger]|uniref:parathyroid hormone-related protein-like n=1 Tax=Conger conger TaxID=82655 RepID=UPI002A5A1E09|nr:parathyroid hormone-related protein-like [Conger conger]XP_061085840.1 parathyroid hormone-related protein-like [Conger conger]XP_061085841.1 parathyroid hormone-related protein-like [Conger conger]